MVRFLTRQVGVPALALACGWASYHVFVHLGWPAWGCYVGALLLGLVLWGAGDGCYERFFDELERTGERPLYAERAVRFFARLVALYLLTAAAMAGTIDGTWKCLLLIACPI